MDTDEITGGMGVPVTLITPALFRLVVFQLSPGHNGGNELTLMLPHNAPLNSGKVLPACSDAVPTFVTVSVPPNPMLVAVRLSLLVVVVRLISITVLPERLTLLFTVSLPMLLLPAREKLDQPVELHKEMEIDYYELMEGVSAECKPEVMDAEHPLFILYTSGSTGTPKGIVHTCGGDMVGTYYTTLNVFDLKDTDVYWCTADTGWITGHSYVVYGPFCVGAT